jgi:large subunit ribosomal protein L17
MKHRVLGRKLGRTSAHRLAVLRNLSTELFERERIETTLMKAKELRPFAERLITLSKRGTLHARRQAAASVTRPHVLQKLFDSLSARYAERPGGYTRIMKLGPRRGDNAEMALLELVGSERKAAAPVEEKKEEKKGLGRLRERLSRGRKAAPADESAPAKKPSRAARVKASKKKDGGESGSGE